MVYQRLPFVVVFASLLVGCAGFVSTPIAPVSANNKQEAAPDGIYYYMPVAPIVVQVAVDANGINTVTLPAISSIPDLSKPYILTVPTNYVGENHATFTVGPNGLLQSAATVQTSGIEALAKAIATTLGTLTTVAAGAPGRATPDQQCAKSTTNSLLIYPEQPLTAGDVYSICGLTVSLRRIGGESPIINSSRASAYGTEQSGIFYKTQVPYLLTVGAAGNSKGQAFIAYSPNESPVKFVPLKKALFANNTTTITLNDGILKTAESDVGGEIIGAVSLPATAIGAYMSAVGKIFDAFKANSSSATGAALSNAQLQLCKAAIAANPIQGVDPTQAATNYAAIKAACSG